MHGLEAEAGLVEPGRLVAGVQQRAVGGVGPPVVAADDVADRAAPVAEDAGAAVPADVVQRPHHLVVVAQDDHGVRPEIDGDVVARLAELRLGGDEQPGPRQHRRHVDVEEVRAGVEGRLQRMADGTSLDERAQVESG